MGVYIFISGHGGWATLVTARPWATDFRFFFLGGRVGQCWATPHNSVNNHYKYAAVKKNTIKINFSI